MASHVASSQTAAKSPYLIGSTNHLTGLSAGYARPYVSGAATYFKWRNDNGGVNGHPIILNTLDDAQNPDRGLANTKQLLNDGILAMIGPAASNVAIPVLPVLSEAKVPTVAVTGVEQIESNPYYYAVGIDISQSLAIAANFAKTHASGPAKIAYLVVDTPSLAAARDATTKLVKSWGWQIVANESFSFNSTDLNAQVRKIAAARPDYILTALTDTMAPIAISLLQNNGVKAPVLNYAAGNAESLFKKIASDQFLAVRDYVDPTEPGDATKPLREAAAKYGTTGDMISNSFTRGWIAGEVIATALESCADPCTGEEVKTALDKLTLDTKGLGPKIVFTPTKKVGPDTGEMYRWDAKLGRAVEVGKLAQAQ
jgi:branched-chain amino acid transport system substrate-binding protein